MITSHKLLIIHQGALGDIVAIFPVIIRLTSYYNCIDVLCQSQPGRLAKHLGLVQKWFPLEDASVSSLFSDQPDPRITARLRPYSKVVLFSFSEQLEQALNQITQNRCIRLAPKPPADPPIHITLYAMQNLMQGGLLASEDLNPNYAYLPIPPVGITNSSPDRRKILLHPGSGSKRKRWPLSGFKQVESVLRTNGLKTEFILGPAEKDLLSALQKRDRKVHLPGDLLELAGLYETAGGYIGNDSGASHLAAFMGLATVVVFGPADPRRWKPNGPRVEVVRPALECRPCFETDRANCSEPKCLDHTIPQTIIDAFYRVYKN